MSVHFDRSRDRWILRWRGNGRHRARRFVVEADAREFDVATSAASPPPGANSAHTAPALPATGSGVYACETDEGTRWRFVFRQSDGRLTTRGFTSPAAAVTARSATVEEVRRGEVPATRDTFRTFWAKVLEGKRPYVTPRTLQDYETHGRKRLLPWLGELKLTQVDEDCVRDWLADMADRVADDELKPKTVNNARTCLSMTLGEAVRRRYIAQNPCRYVPELPVVRGELEYLRPNEIARHLEACLDHYRPLAEFLIGTGARVSEPIAVRWTDLNLDARTVHISRQLARAGTNTTPTKGRRDTPVPRPASDAARANPTSLKPP